MSGPVAPGGILPDGASWSIGVNKRGGALPLGWVRELGKGAAVATAGVLARAVALPEAALAHQTKNSAWTRFARPRMDTGRALAIVLGLALVLVSGYRLLCARQLLPGEALLRKPCAWLGCSGPGCDDTSPSLGGLADSNASAAALRQLGENPGSPRPWLVAGQTFFFDGQFDAARYCFERTVALAPQSPPVLVQVAAFFHAIDRRNEGLALLSRALSLTREYDGVIFPLYDRLTDASTILRLGVPLEKSAAQAYFAYLLDGDEIELGDIDGGEVDRSEIEPGKMDRGEMDRVGLAWDWLSRNELTNQALLRRYLTQLLEQQRFDTAATVAANFLPVGERPTNGNRIHHGGFEAAASVTPLDWIITDNAHAQVRRDDLLAWEGAWSLRVEFDGQQNLEYRNVSQQVVVSSGRWKLSARIRSAGITTDQGIGLRLFDTWAASRWQLWTGTVQGDSDWTLIETSFVIPAETRLVQLELVRRRSDRFDNKLGGVFWIDAVSLRPLS